VNALKKINWSGWLFFGLLLLAWELGARGAPKLQLYFPPLSRVLVALVASVQTGALVRLFSISRHRCRARDYTWLLSLGSPAF